MMITMVWLLGCLFGLALLLLIREAYIFLHWKTSVGRLDRHEWTRRLASMREE